MQSKIKVILIGGSSHSGKSTLAKALSEELGAQCISTDSLARHPGRPWKEHPDLIPIHVQEHYASLSVDELLVDVLSHLPASEELKAVYEHEVGAGHFRTQGRLSALYQVGSALFLDAQLVPTTTDRRPGDERSLAIQHWPHCQPDDLIIYDRGYPSYDFMYRHQQAGLAFVMRVPIVFNKVTARRPPMLF